MGKNPRDAAAAIVAELQKIPPLSPTKLKLRALAINLHISDDLIAKTIAAQSTDPLHGVRKMARAKR